jgi:hypothetical protein
MLFYFFKKKIPFYDPIAYYTSIVYHKESVSLYVV